ncbi:MAG TPA: HAD hydrolase-like protein [Methylobacterium sp.]|uniref:HAD hydrolase-like protein n=1 Tax=Methylorubrum sp. B1-46 TaxID=2897334 RepID=UPI001E452F8E|nr:HAD hydrolase-like protein [Methylorubrum sp. B1-46]UGB27946.1 HAD hydrolase-like protein [Methylorubrum sp. B1-46]HEV2542331.1 HAD hydrolase-like protein [Methylobacterium sp.]
MSATTQEALAPAAPYRLVAFDFDGTLADTFPWFCANLNDVAARYRFRRVEAGETERLRGLGARAILKDLGIPAWKVPLIARHMRALAAREAGQVRLFPGVPEMLAGLDAAGIALAVVSSNSESNVRRALGESAGLIRHYDCGAALFGKARHLRAVARAAGFDPAEMLAVGDEIRDAEAAERAGCAFAAVAWGYNSPEALAGVTPAYLFAKPGDVVRALAGPRRRAY